MNTEIISTLESLIATSNAQLATLGNRLLQLQENVDNHTNAHEQALQGNSHQAIASAATALQSAQTAQDKQLAIIASFSLFCVFEGDMLAFRVEATAGSWQRMRCKRRCDGRDCT